MYFARSIGRIGCTLVHDHIGRATDSMFGVDYPRAELAARQVLDEIVAGGGHGVETIRCHNMAMYELAYLIPVNILILTMAFSKKRRAADAFGDEAVLETLRVLHRLAVDAHHHVAGAQAGARRRTLGVNLGDQRA